MEVELSNKPSASEYAERANQALEKWRETQPARIAIDTETEGVAYFDPAFAITIAWCDEGYYFELDIPDAVSAAREIILGTDIWLFHNAKFDLQKLILGEIIEREDISWERIHDTEALAHLIDENQKKGLKDLAVNLLGWDDTIEVEIKSGPNQGQMRKVAREKHELDAVRRKLKLKKEDGYHRLPREFIIPYAITDAVMTEAVYNYLTPIMARQDEGLRELYDRERQLAVVLLDIEMAGMRVDMNYVNKMSRDLARELMANDIAIRQLSGREEFKDHHMWIKPVLAELGIDVSDTQKATLKTIEHPIVKHILEWRRLKKLWDYFNAIQREQRDGILHPNFRQHGTKTGRMSSGGALED